MFSDTLYRKGSRGRPYFLFLSLYLSGKEFFSSALVISKVPFKNYNELVKSSLISFSEW